jgi:hypothetical protein
LKVANVTPKRNGHFKTRVLVISNS